MLDYPSDVETVSVYSEPFYTEKDPVFYYNSGIPNTSMMFLNFGFMDFTVYGRGKRRIHLKNLRNLRQRKSPDGYGVFLGKKSLIQIDGLATSTVQGAVSMDFLLSPAYVTRKFDPRDFNFPAFTIRGASGRGAMVIYRPSFGWMVVVFTEEHTEKFGSATAAYVNLWGEGLTHEYENTIPNTDNPRPLSLVLSWDAAGLSGYKSDVNIVLWVNGIPVIENWSGLLGQKPSAASNLLLGGAVPLQQIKDSTNTKCSAYYSNVKVYTTPVIVGVKGGVALLSPETYIDLSTDGINWENYSSGGLPIRYKDVPQDSYAKIYLRSRLPHKDTVKYFSRRTSYISAEWVIK